MFASTETSEGFRFSKDTRVQASVCSFTNEVDSDSEHLLPSVKTHTQCHPAVAAGCSSGAGKGKGVFSLHTVRLLRPVLCNSMHESLSHLLLHSTHCHRLKLSRLISNHLIMKQNDFICILLLPLLPTLGTVSSFYSLHSLL